LAAKLHIISDSAKKEHGKFATAVILQILQAAKHFMTRWLILLLPLLLCACQGDKRSSYSNAVQWY